MVASAGWLADIVFVVGVLWTWSQLEEYSLTWTRMACGRDERSVARIGKRTSHDYRGGINGNRARATLHLGARIATATQKSAFDSSFNPLPPTYPQILSKVNALASREQTLKITIFAKKRFFSVITFDSVEARYLFCQHRVSLVETR